VIPCFTFPLGRIEPAPEFPSPGGNRACDWRGQRFQWRPSLPDCRRTAFDAERLATPVPEVLRPAGMSPRDFFAAWTRAEALAKCYDVPILAWLRQHPLTAPRLDGIEHFLATSAPEAFTFTTLWPEQELMFTCAWISGQIHEPARPSPCPSPTANS
jgi:hypothetical protein